MVLLLESLLLAFIFLACHADAIQHVAPQALHATSTPGVSDYLALMSFKSRITSDPSRSLASWGNLSLPMCQWQGVVCGLSRRRRGRVVVLDLGELNLLGTITPALGNLTYMRRLNLAQNHFHGALPQELGNLHDLETVQLSYNSIQGEIPPPLSNCTRLVSVSLHGNILQGEIPSEFISSLHNLQLLDLGENRLTGRIPPSIGSLVNLKHLILKFNNLTGEIPTEIGRLENLNELSLGFNQFSGTLPNSLGNLSALTFLSIPGNKLEGSIPPLQSLLSLNVLELAQNNLEGTIPSFLGNLSSLKYLDFQENALVGQIPESLGSLGLLTTLSLSTNHLSGLIPDVLGNLQALTGLYIDTNKLEGFFPLSMLNLSSLEILNIQFNNLTGSLPSDVGSKFPNLKQFLVTDNQLRGALPSSLCNATMLQWIQTTSNFLSGTVPRCLGARQKNLSIVWLEANQFEATNNVDWEFLTSLTNCSKMKVLDVGTNKLQGVLPNSIANLSTQLEYLVMSYNNIAGIITEEIGNLVNLKELIMTNNVLKGDIPASLSKLNNLNKLSLSNNALSGPIPVTFGNLTKLTILLLSTNAITGAIPSSLSNCPLEVLDLSHNKLSGPTPKELFSITTLSRFMYLAHNSLSGSFPIEVRNLKNLGELDFSSNIISGVIPTSIGECESLERLNISGNLLQGTIPLSLGNLTGLSVLDLSYNNLSGTIPEILGSLRGLSSLNLSFNNFQGGVPTGGVFQNPAAIMITGNDGLCGGIPQLKLQPCSNHTNKKLSWKLIIAVFTSSAFLLVALVFALCKFHQKTGKIKADLQIAVISDKYTRVSYAELSHATNGFSSENLIGAGSFGSVYKGRIGDNGNHMVVAIKVLNLIQRGASQSFVAECETLRCVRHRNLVQILTVCSSIDSLGREFKAIVYEFLPNGNLDQRLHQRIIEDGEPKTLDLLARLCIAIDVASSLDYLHQHRPTPIIHCDLKPSNILLDKDMVAHVGDFGLARFLHQETDKSSGWASMRGSIDYAAPEYGLGNEVSTHGDVYSYGILLLEMFSGKRPTDSEFGEAIGLRKYVQMALPDRVRIIIDQQLLSETRGWEEGTLNSGSFRDTRIACVTSILQVGISCSEEAPMDRLSISDALKELQAVRDKFHMHFSDEGAPSIC